MILTFFGLNETYKPKLHNQLFELVYYGKGFTWTELYNMPVWLRSFYYKKIEEALQKQKKDSEKTSKNSKPPKVVKPNIGPRK